METMRITAAELKAGQFVFVGETELHRGPWDVVQVHPDGSATVRVELRRPSYEPPVMYASGRSDAESIVMHTGAQTVHNIVYVRGPLSQRYRCKGCDWVGALPAEHP